MARNDGGSALPIVYGDDWQGVQKGMTLRDWFAGQAMAAIIAKHPAMGEPFSADNGSTKVPVQMTHQIMDGIARGAYAYADAMLAAREAE